MKNTPSQNPPHQQNNKQNHEQAHRAPPLARDWNSPVQRRLSRAVLALAITAGNLNDVNIANRLEIARAREPVPIKLARDPRLSQIWTRAKDPKPSRATA